MADIVVLGAGVGGLPAAYDLKHTLGKAHEVTLVGSSEQFQFTPSNPWVAVGWRKPGQIQVPIRPNVERKGIGFIAQTVQQIDAAQNRLVLADGQAVAYDYLVIATGPRLPSRKCPARAPSISPRASAPRRMRAPPGSATRPFSQTRARS